SWKYRWRGASVGVMFVDVCGTIVAFDSFTLTATVEPWITSPFVGVMIWTFAGLLGRGVPETVVNPDDAFVPDEHADRTTASAIPHGTSGRRRVELMSRHLPAPRPEARESLSSCGGVRWARCRDARSLVA